MTIFNSEQKIEQLEEELSQARAYMAEALPMLQRLHGIMIDLEKTQSAVSKQAETISRLQAERDDLETKEAECGHLDRWWKAEPDGSAWCVMCALEKANRQLSELNTQYDFALRQVDQLNEIENIILSRPEYGDGGKTVVEIVADAFARIDKDTNDHA